MAALPGPSLKVWIFPHCCKVFYSFFHFKQTSKRSPKQEVVFLKTSLKRAPLRVCVVSVPVPAVETMEVYDETQDSMWVKWDNVEGATGYMLLYRPISDPQLEKEVHALCAPPDQKGLAPHEQILKC